MRTSGSRPQTATIVEYDFRKVIDISSTDFKWDEDSDNAFFKIVCDGDYKLKCRLVGETEAEGKANGFFPFPTGEGSNAKVLEVYKDAESTMGTKMWAVRLR